MVSKYGERLSEVCVEKEAEVAKEFGITRTAVKNIADALVNHKQESKTKAWFSLFGLTLNQMDKIYERYQGSAISILQENPYLLLHNIKGLGFYRVDEIALKMGVKPLMRERLQAALFFVLQEKAQEGDTYMTLEELPHLASEILHCDDKTLVAAAMLNLIEKGELMLLDDEIVMLPSYQRKETELYSFFQSRGKEQNPHFRTLDIPEALNEDQRRAFSSVLQNQLTVITGGAGTGKTYLIASLCEACERDSVSYILCAPTGKAAQRIKESTGRNAHTIHRALQLYSATAKAQPLKEKVVIVDEFSMVNVDLAHTLMEALRPDTTLVLLGDHNQLPPIGPGCLLRDMTQGTGYPVVVLTQAVRQAGELEQNSRAILEGEMIYESEVSDNGLMPWVVNPAYDSAEAIAFALHRHFREFANQHGLALDEIQVLTPQRKGPAGSINLNRLIQAIHHNLPITDPYEGKMAGFRAGDRVIQCSNNYDLGVMNGQIGYIRKPVGEKSFLIEWDNEVRAEYEEADMQNVELAYALTIHKAQGSEYPCVFVICHSTHRNMLSRNLLYTAVTRAKKICRIIGNRAGINTALRENQEKQRRTYLAWQEGRGNLNGHHNHNQ